MAHAYVKLLDTAGSGGANTQRWVYALTFFGDDVSAEIATGRQIEITVNLANSVQPSAMNDAILVQIQIEAARLGLTISSTDVWWSPLKRMETSLAENVMALGPVEWHRFGIGITSAGGFCSQWDDYCGNGHHLKQSIGTNQFTLEADGSLTADGVDNFMATDPYVLIQPTTVCILANQLTWTVGETVLDGVVTNTGRIQQVSLTPRFNIYSGSYPATDNTLWLVGGYAVIFAGFSDTNSFHRVNNNAAITGTTGAGNMGGLTIGAVGGGGSSWGNIGFMEIIVFPSLLDSSGQAIVSAHLAQVGGLSI